jgi:hypothetical protein
MVGHCSWTSGQRGWKRQPGGMAVGSGGSPLRIWGLRRSRGFRGGTADSSALV